MSMHFLDTSAIVKRYIIEEPGHEWLSSLCLPSKDQRLYISQAALVEVVATICRKSREQSLTPDHRDLLISKFRHDVQNDYKVWRVTSALYVFAGDLCRIHKLRAYDAIQLACALQLRDKALSYNMSLPIFVCADNDLLEFALVEGLGIENPNNYAS